MNGAIYIGRFQPFHNGHLSVIKEVINKFDYLIIGIGSAYESHMDDNPYSTRERLMMIWESLEPKYRQKCFIIPIPDVNRYGIWMAHIADITPPFTHVITRNLLTEKLARNSGYNVYKPKSYKRDHYRGTWVRMRIREGALWDKLVPKAVAKIINGR